MKLQYLLIIVIFYFNSVASQEKNIIVKFNVSLKEQDINPKVSDDYKYFQKVCIERFLSSTPEYRLKMGGDYVE